MSEKTKLIIDFNGPLHIEDKSQFKAVVRFKMYMLGNQEINVSNILTTVRIPKTNQHTRYLNLIKDKSNTFNEAIISIIKL